jgi:hypothetical protein
VFAEMIDTDPAIGTTEIWQRLADDHGTTVAYPALRTYVTNRRTAMQPPLSGPE